MYYPRKVLHGGGHSFLLRYKPKDLPVNTLENQTQPVILRQNHVVQKNTPFWEGFPILVSLYGNSIFGSAPNRLQQWTILLFLIPRVALRVSTTNCASSTMRA